MADFALPTLVMAAVALLARSGVAHLRHHSAMGTLLDRQALLPSPLRPVVALGLGPTEIALAVATASALLGEVAIGLVGGLLTAVGIAFALLLILLARTRPPAPCGCSGVTESDAEGVGPLDGLRAGVVLAGGLALVGGAGERLAGLDATEAGTVVVAGVALAATIDVAARVRPPTQATARLSPRSGSRFPSGESEIGSQNAMGAGLGRGARS